MTADGFESDGRFNMRKFFILIICLTLITGIFFGAFFLVSRFSKRDSGNERNDLSEKPVIEERITGTALNEGFAEAVFETDASNGQINRILVCILSKKRSRLDVIEINTGISYTMTQQLYAELTPEKVTLPQTILFSELYAYYGDERSYEAGLKVIGEMLGAKLDRCAVFDAGGFDEDYYKNVRECGGAETVYHELPVIKHNETILPDMEGIESIMCEVLSLNET